MTILTGPTQATRERELADARGLGALYEFGKTLVAMYGAGRKYSEPLWNEAANAYLAREAEIIAHGGVPTRAALEPKHPAKSRACVRVVENDGPEAA